jgi:phosphatidylethanolamine-binding protein (PEBP) family uncharacterized protein
MRRRDRAIASAALVLSLTAAGCDSASSPSSAVVVPFKSPALIGATLPSLYTCDGRNVSPPLEWGPVPAATKELAVFVLGLTPNPATHKYKVSIEWVIAGVKPKLHRIAAGRLPAGAYVGSNSDGQARYSVCPAKGRSTNYEFALYGVPASVRIPPRFSGVELLRAIVGPEAATVADVKGGFSTSYTRRSRAEPDRH